MPANGVSAAHTSFAGKPTPTELTGSACDLVLCHFFSAAFHGQGLGLLVAVLVDGEVGIALTALAVCVFLPGGNPGVIALGVANADFAGGVEGGDLTGAKLGKWPVFAVDLLAFFVALFGGGFDGFVLSAVFLEGKGLLEAFFVVFNTNPRAVGAARLDDADVVKRIQFFHKNLSLDSITHRYKGLLSFPRN